MMSQRISAQDNNSSTDVLIVLQNRAYKCKSVIIWYSYLGLNDFLDSNTVKVANGKTSITKEVAGRTFNVNL